jgi:5-methylcytosine-specific restriction endonuclease McrA
MRPRMPNATRRALAQKYNCVPGQRTVIECHWCDETALVTWRLNSDGTPSHWPTFGLSIDHLLPLSRGGTHDLENLVFACGFCNSSRSAKTVEEFDRYIEQRAAL